MVSIYDWFGYEVPIQERYKLIKEAGFDGVLLWWCDGFGRGEGYRDGVSLARNTGLIIENIHTPVMEQNDLSLDNLAGENLFNCYSQCIKDCHDFNIPTMVVHLPSDDCPINELGMDRIKKLTDMAEQYKVKVAMENLFNVNNLALVLNSIDSKQVGFCYDSCHHENNKNAGDLLKLYGNRLIALHLHDNGGEMNQHQLPLDGNIDWNRVMKEISKTGYTGATSLEPMNWSYKDISIREFLSLAYKKVKKLESMRIENM